MADFNVSRNRDASSAILGFCYQVDCTIARWLTLDANQSLELERGEDIDIVAQSLLGDSEAPGRQLEQVKHLSRRVSLRNQETLAFVANAVEHRSTNPGHALIFRFITNAEVASERPAAFDDRMSAIRAWEAIRHKGFSEVEVAVRLTGLRAFLLSTKQPRDVPDATWDGFRVFVGTADDSALHSLINSVEWSTSNPNAAGMQIRVKELLQALGFSSDSGHAEELHGRLFLHVIRVLSQSGRKCLARAELIRQITAAPLSDSERQLLRTVSAHITALDSRVETLETLIREQHTAILSPLLAQVQLLATAENIPSQLIPAHLHIDTASPPRISHLCRRQMVVDSISQECAGKSCLVLHGAVGAGKTQLGLLLLEKLGRDPVWLALRDLPAPLATSTILHGLHQESGSTVKLPLRAIVEAIKERGRTAIVLDDTPAVLPGSPIASLICELALCGQEFGIFVLMLSHHALPPGVQEHAQNQIVSRVVPPFAVGEAADVFARHGADSALCKHAAIEELNGIAGGHPWMLAAIARFFESREWRIDQQGMDAVNRFAHADSLLEDVVRRVIATVQDSDSRALLYRLGLAIGEFTVDTVQAVSLVDPALDRPRERLSAVSGLWIDRRSNMTMTVCPLIRPLAHSELRPEVRRSVLLRLAETILHQSGHSIGDLSTALSYLSSAGAFNRAALLLIVALRGSSRLPRDLALQLFALSKVPRSITSEIANELRIYLESERIRLASRLGRPIDKALRRLLDRCKRAGRRSAWAVFSSSLALAPKAARQDFSLGLEFIHVACDVYKHVRTPVGRKRFRIARFRPEYLLWQVVPYIQSQADVIAWLDVLAGMTDEQRRRTLAWPDAEEGVRIAVSRAWTKEFEQPDGERSWNGVFDFYEWLKDRARQLGIESIWAEAVASQIVVLADYLRNLPEAVRTAHAALGNPDLSELSRYRIVDSLGRQFVYHREYSKAIEWLDRGFALAGEHFPVHRCWSYLELARALADADSTAAVAAIQEAVELARNRPREVGGMSLSLALGELAIARWLTGDLKKCFEAFDEAVDLFLIRKDRSVDWRQRFACFGHAASFFATLTNTGRPPETAYDGSPFAPPCLGFFMSFNPSRVTLYDEAQSVLIYSLMAYFAQGVGEDIRAGEWGLRGIDRAREVGHLAGMQQLNSYASPALLATGRYVEALDAAVECCHATIALMERHKRGDSTFAPRLSICEELGAKPNPLWDFAEQQSVTFGVIPLVMQLASELRSGQDVQESISDVLDLLQRYASEASDPAGWPSVVTFFEAVFLNPMPWRELLALATQAARQGRSQLHNLGYLGVSLLPDTPIESAAICQAIVIAYLAPQFVIEATTYRRIVLPFLCDFWARTLQEQRFRFSSPEVVVREFEEAVALVPEVRGQAVVRCILNGLKIPLAKYPQVADWLASAK